MDTDVSTLDYFTVNLELLKTRLYPEKILDFIPRSATNSNLLALPLFDK